MPATTITIEGLHGEYAKRIADGAALDAVDYPPTAASLAQLCTDAADRLGWCEPVRDWLTEAADSLRAIDRLGDDGPKTQQLLSEIDQTLYDAADDLAIL